MIAVGKNEPSGNPILKCRCRQQVTLEEANKHLDEGTARRLVTKRWYEPVAIACKLCKGDETFKNCARCHGKRTEVENVTREEHGDAIVAVSQPTVDKTRKYRPVVTGKTPRTQTIEKAHMERLVQGRKDEAERIEAYGLMIKEVQASLIVGYEPEDNPKTGEGRRFDYGRAIIIK